MIESLYWTIKHMFGRGRGVVQSDSGPVQLVQLQLSEIETKDRIPRIAEYGFASNPPDGFTGVALFFGGDRTSAVVIATQHQQFRFHNLAKGECALSDNQGQSVYLSATGIKITDKAGSTITLNGDGTATMTLSGGLTINANTSINGTLTATGNIIGDQNITAVGSVADAGGAKTMSGMRTAYDGHTHTDPQGGTTGTPSALM